MYQISFYVPLSHAEQVKSAMFEVGAGKIGDYDSCCFEYEGQGQFRPLKGSDPYLGKEGALEKVNELKVEMVCEDHLIEMAVEALKASHPYETPAYYVIKTVGI
jgi:hypothetical protein